MKDFKAPNGLSEMGFEKDCFEKLAIAASSGFTNIFPIETNCEIITKMYELSWKVY
jgi:hypothetical protein